MVGLVAGRNVENAVPKLSVASRVGGRNVVVVGSVPELRALAGTKMRLLVVVVGTGTEGRAVLIALKDLSATGGGGAELMGKNGVGCRVVKIAIVGRWGGGDVMTGKNGVGCLPFETVFWKVPGRKASLGVGGRSCRIVGLKDGTGPGTVGLCVTGLCVVGLCGVGLGVVWLGSVGLGVVSLAVVNRNVVGLGVVGLCVVGLGVVSLSVVGLCVVRLCVVGL